jgi:agmatine deiminase
MIYVSRTIDSTPRKDGFRMPGEFHPHAGTWILWPERPDNWRYGGKPAQQVFAEVATAIAEFEPVTMGVSQGQYRHARTLLLPQIRVVEMSYNDAWIRDCGPTFVVNGQGEVRGVDWDFNAWGGLKGGLYFPWDQDDLVAQKVLEIEGMDRYKAKFVVEGGAIEVDGEGTLIATESCVLNANRNPDMTREEVEANLKEYLSLEKVIWLREGVYLDETDGHIDNLCRFVRPGLVVLTWTDDTADPQYPVSLDAYERLTNTTDARGRKLEIHKIHQPNPIVLTKEETQGVDSVEGTLPRRQGDRLAGSYVNFYFTNGGMVMPTFNDSHDRAALETIQRLCPDRKVVGIPAREILLGGGNIHCITQQQPKG